MRKLFNFLKRPTPWRPKALRLFRWWVAPKFRGLSRLWFRRQAPCVGHKPDWRPFDWGLCRLVLFRPRRVHAFRL